MGGTHVVFRVKCLYVRVSFPAKLGGLYEGNTYYKYVVFELINGFFLIAFVGHIALTTGDYKLWVGWGVWGGGGVGLCLQ